MKKQKNQHERSYKRWSQSEFKLIDAYSEMYQDLNSIESKLPILSQLLGRSKDALRLRIDAYRFDHLNLPILYTRPGYHINRKGKDKRRKILPRFSDN